MSKVNGQQSSSLGHRIAVITLIFTIIGVIWTIISSFIPSNVIVIPPRNANIRFVKLNVDELIEGSSTRTVTLERTGNIQIPLTVKFQLASNVTASLREVEITGATRNNNLYSIAFLAGQAQKSFEVAALDDGVVESQEILTFELVGDSNYTLGSPSTINLYIVDNVAVNDNIMNDAPVIDTFVATPSILEAGQSTTLVWIIAKNIPADLDISPNVGNVSTLDEITITPVSSTTYTLTASNEAGSVSESITVQVKTSEQATLSAPSSIEGGESFLIDYTGPNASGDYITMVPVDAPEGSYDSRSFFYPSSTSGKGTLTAAPTAGEYEIRYIIDEDDVTIARRSITVTPPVVTLEAPDTVSAGTEFVVNFTGPNASGDYITIVPAGSRQGTYRDFFYPSSKMGSDFLSAPDTAGNYEIRYVFGEGDVTASSIQITVF
ncbi:MAG: hypothetical protein AAF708_12510 [Deinococcota bacterium]